ncbi:PH domain-containing protein [Actinoplanes campanulatus]|uniref:PH domain-containing protein n=1 Tax=Actinoplanes campanulatus TaxID=113559 RepID=UPI001606C467
MAGFALLGAFLLRLAMVRVVLHEDHIALVNPLRTLRFHWLDVEDIDIVSSGGWIVRVRAGGVPRWAWGCRVSDGSGCRSRACTTTRPRTRRVSSTTAIERCVPPGSGETSPITRRSSAVEA